MERKPSREVRGNPVCPECGGTGIVPCECCDRTMVCPACGYDDEADGTNPYDRWSDTPGGWDGWTDEIVTGGEVRHV